MLNNHAWISPAQLRERLRELHACRSRCTAWRRKEVSVPALTWIVGASAWRTCPSRCCPERNPSSIKGAHLQELCCSTGSLDNSQQHCGSAGAAGGVRGREPAGAGCAEQHARADRAQGARLAHTRCGLRAFQQQRGGERRRLAGGQCLFRRHRAALGPAEQRWYVHLFFFFAQQHVRVRDASSC